jgi:hypothetical protein
MTPEERQAQFSRIDEFLDRFHRESPYLFNLFTAAIAVSIYFLGWWLWDLLLAFFRTL